MDLQRPKVRKVTVLVEGYDGQSVQFTYLDTRPGEEPDESSGIVLEVATDATRPDDEFDSPYRIPPPMRYTHSLRIENSPTYTVEAIKPPVSAADAEAIADGAALDAARAAIGAAP